MAIHKIKSWTHFYDAIVEGRKLHDLRKMDRDYNVGDILVLQRYDNINGYYTGEEQRVKVTYITSNKTPCAFSSSALDRDYAILSLQLLPEISKEGEEIRVTVNANDTNDTNRCYPTEFEKLFANGFLAKGGPINMDIKRIINHG